MSFDDKKLEKRLLKWRETVVDLQKVSMDHKDINYKQNEYTRAIEDIDGVLSMIQEIRDEDKSIDILDVVLAYIRSEYYVGTLGSLKTFIYDLQENPDEVIARGRRIGWL